MRQAILIAAALVAGFVGAYAGLFALLAATGLDAPGWSPVTMLAGAALFGSLAASLTARLPSRTVLALVGGSVVAGTLVGVLVMPLRDGFDWMVGCGVLLVIAVAVVARRLETAST